MARLSRYIVWPLAAAGGYGALHWAANTSVYVPSRYPRGLWSLQAQLGAADVWLETPDGIRIHGWSVQRPGSRLATLFLHGNAGNLTHRSSRIPEIVAAGSSVLVIDYRGYGKSAGRPTESGLYTDAETAYRHLLDSGYRAGQIVLHGESLGTAVAVDLAARVPCGAVVLEAPFTSARDVARTVLPVLGPALIWSFDSLAKIPRVRAPMLFIHGDQDEIIPLRLGRDLFAAAPGPKSLWIVPGASHNDILDVAGPDYRRRLQSFYETVGAGAGS